MSSDEKKRKSDEPAEVETKRNKQETSTEGMKDEDFKFYCPRCSIFQDDDNDPTKMGGSKNFLLAKSFYHSRYDIDNKLKEYDDRNNFERNAGAVQLYNKDGVNVYKIHKQKDHKEEETHKEKEEEAKEYNCVSYGNKKAFKSKTMRDFGKKASTFGHSERKLMAMILDDLIKAHGDEKEIQPPGDYCNYEVLKNLVPNAHKYKEYLEKKNVIVKMWSERPSCTDEDMAGGACEPFMKSICPAGSKFGYIVKDYTREDNQFGAPKVKDAFEEFRKAYKDYTHAGE